MYTRSMPNLLKNIRNNDKGDVNGSTTGNSGEKNTEQCEIIEQAELDPRVSTDQISNLSLLDLYDNAVNTIPISDFNTEVEINDMESDSDTDTTTIFLRNSGYSRNGYKSTATYTSTLSGSVTGSTTTIGSAPGYLQKEQIKNESKSNKNKNRKYSTSIKNSIDNKNIYENSTPTGEDKREKYFPSTVSLGQSLEQYDRYGFKKQTAFVTEEEYNLWWNQYSQYCLRRKKKWVIFLEKNNVQFDPATGKPTNYPTRSEKLKRYIRKGVPAEWRGDAWWFFANGDKYLKDNQGLYNGLLYRVFKRNSEQKHATDIKDDGEDEMVDKIKPDVTIIERDLNRTFPENIHFMKDSDREPVLITSLRRVLYAFALYDPKIGYCQSMNFLAGLLLLFLDEEKAFWMLVIITHDILPNVHNRNLEGVSVDQGVLMLCIKEYLPEFWNKMNAATAYINGDNADKEDGSGDDDKKNKNDNNNNNNNNNDCTEYGDSQRASVKKNEFLFKLPPITLCTASWFMSCFIGTVPIETTLRIWDCIFYEGSHLLFKISLAVIKLSELEAQTASSNSASMSSFSSFYSSTDGFRGDSDANGNSSTGSLNGNNDSQHSLRNSVIMRKFSRNKFKKLNSSQQNQPYSQNYAQRKACDDFEIELFQTFQSFPKTLISPNDMFEKIIFKKKYSLNTLNQEEIERCRKYVILQRSKFKKYEDQQQGSKFPGRGHHKHQNSVITFEDLDHELFESDVYGFRSSTTGTLKERVLRIARKTEKTD